MKAFLRKHKFSVWLRLAVFTGSLLLSLAVCEAGLRLAGYAVTAGRQNVFIPAVDEGEHDADLTFERYQTGAGKGPLILTFGDSLTNGNNLPSSQSFPYQLFTRLAASGSRAAVYNLGKCEESTFGAAAKFKSYLQNSSPSEVPDVAILLVGAADLFNLPLMQERMSEDRSVWHDIFPRGWIYSLRVYKVFRHIRTQWSLPRGHGEEPADEKFKLLLRAYQAHKAYGGDVLSPEIVKDLAPVFGKEARRYDLDLRSVGDFMELVADYAARVYSTQVRYDELFSLLLEIAEAYPSDFWTDTFDGANFQFVQIYQVQSKYTAQDVLKVIQRSEQEHPELRDNEDFRNFRRVLTDREEMDLKVERLRMHTWEEVVRLSRERNVRLVLQNYPVAYTSANRTLGIIASKYGIPLVDNRTLFAELIEREGRGKFMEDNDHLTPAGNERMAENVFKTLARTGILGPGLSDKRLHELGY